MARPTDASAEELRAFSRALGAELNSRRMTKADLGRDLDARGETVHQTTLSNWAAGKHEPSRRQVRLIEEVLDVPPGLLSRHLGYLPASVVPATDLPSVIAELPDLAPEDRALLLDMYERLRSVERARQRQ